MPKRSKFYSIDKQGSNFHHDKKARIGILSEEIMSYYRNVSASLESGFDEDATLKDEFLTNVYITLRDEGLQVSQNQTVSRILEVLFSQSKPHHMQGLFCQFCGELTVVAFDRFASHVFQSLIQYLPAMYDIKDEYSPYIIGGKSFSECVEQLCSFMESHLRDVMTHTYGSHVLRALLEVLGGVRVNSEVIRSRVSRVQSKDGADDDVTERTMSKSLSEDFSANFNELTAKLIRFCNFEDHLSDPNYCPLLQTVLLILHKVDHSEYQTITNTIIEKSGLLRYNEDAPEDDVTQRLPDLVQNEVGSFLAELLLSLATEEELEKLYDQIFKQRIVYYAVHPIANYVLQKMISCVSQTAMMELLLSDILTYLEDILAVNHIGIVTKLAEACRRTGTGQENFMKVLMAAFHCYEPEDRQSKIVTLIASLQTYDLFYGESSEVDKTKSEAPKENLLKTVNFHGSLVLQQLFQFANTRLVCSSFLSLTPAELVGLCCDKCGSHIVDTFFQSKTVFEKNKISLLKKLNGVYINIACNRNGSRCLESIWKGCNVKQKIIIAEELAKNQARLEGDQWGRFLYRNFALWKFSQRKQEWLDIQGASTKRQQILNDILQGTGSKKKKRKQKQGPKEGKSGIKETVANSAETGIPNAETKSVVTKGQENKEMKAKAGKSFSTDSEIPQTDLSHDAEGDGETESKKKRKRSKEKKRLIRAQELEAEIHEPDSQKHLRREKKKAKTVVEQRQLELDASPVQSLERSESGSTEGKKKKKRKLEINSESEMVTDKKSVKKSKEMKGERYEKTGKLKTLKSKS